MKRFFTIVAMLGAAAVVLPAQDDAGMQEAIRFERAKDAADARQARIEAQKTAAIAKNRAQLTRKEKPAPGKAARQPAVQTASHNPPK